MPTRNEAWPDGTPSWVDLAVDDVQAARAFYSSLFGWDIQDGPADAGGYLMALKDGRPAAGIGPKMGEGMPTVWSTYFATSNVDATAERIREAGGTVFMDPFDVMTSGRMTIAADPTGAAFGLWQAGEHVGAGIFNEPGTYTWNELHTKDYEPARAFYAAVFGYTYEDIGGEGFTYSTFTLPGGDDSVGGMFHNLTLPEGVPAYWLTWFAVADCDESLAQANELGAETLMPVDDSPFGRMAIVRGAQGEIFGIIQNPQGPA